MATRWLLAGVLTLLVAGSPGVADTSDEELAASRAVAAMNALGARLLGANLSDPETAGRMISPLSLGSALVMVAQGAKGDTAEALAAAFEVNATSGLQELATAGGLLLRNLQTNTEGQVFRSANALWVAPDLRLHEPFAERLRADFDAAVATLNFADTDAINQVNEWFAEATDGMIGKMFEDLSPDTRVLLANALHFRATWQVPFHPGETAEAPFRLPNGGVVQASFMQRTGEMRYRETDEGLQAVLLGFEGGDFEMLLLLPPAAQDSRIWGAALTAAAWAELLDPQHYLLWQGALQLPRVALRSGGSVRDQLSALGLGIAFSPQADFAALAGEPLQLDQIVHRTALDWDETGAEAAAATAVTTTRSSSPALEAFHMTLDRPFFAALRHVESGAIVLHGLVVRPEVANQ